MNIRDSASSSSSPIVSDSNPILLELLNMKELVINTLNKCTKVPNIDNFKAAITNFTNYLEWSKKNGQDFKIDFETLHDTKDLLADIINEFRIYDFHLLRDVAKDAIESINSFHQVLQNSLEKSLVKSLEAPIDKFEKIQILNATYDELKASYEPLLIQYNSDQLKEFNAKAAEYIHFVETELNDENYKLGRLNKALADLLTKFTITHLARIVRGFEILHFTILTDHGLKPVIKNTDIESKTESDQINTASTALVNRELDLVTKRNSQSALSLFKTQPSSPSTSLLQALKAGNYDLVQTIADNNAGLLFDICDNEKICPASYAFETLDINALLIMFESIESNIELLKSFHLQSQKPSINSAPLFESCQDLIAKLNSAKPIFINARETLQFNQAEMNEALINYSKEVNNLPTWLLREYKHHLNKSYSTKPSTDYTLIGGANYDVEKIASLFHFNSDPIRERHKLCSMLQTDCDFFVQQLNASKEEVTNFKTIIEKLINTPEEHAALRY